MKNYIDDEEATEHLRKAGWSEVEIARLRELRRHYIAQKSEYPVIPSRHHSAFVRWLLVILEEGFGPPVP